MATKKQMLTEILSVRLSAADVAALDTAIDALPSFKRVTIVRIAMRLGLELLRKEPSRALSALTATCPSKTRRAKRGVG